jgi:DNA-damage-inducible protein D
MKQEIVKSLFKNFEEASHAQDGVEYWLARELQFLLGYSRWENFVKVIEKAEIACMNAGASVNDHFLGVTKMVELGSGSERSVEDILLTRYACYLIAQNGDPRKDEIAFAMSYFAIQTRKQEIIEQRINELERLQAREKLSSSEKQLSGIIYQRGVDNMGFGRIRSKGDEALFGGYTTQEMKRKLKIAENKPLADFLPTITIKAKDFANEITNFNIKKDDLYGETAISAEHVKNNRDVRDVLVKRGIKPETLPAEEDIKKVERKVGSAGKALLKETKKLGGKKKKG